MRLRLRLRLRLRDRIKRPVREWRPDSTISQPYRTRPSVRQSPQPHTAARQRPYGRSAKSHAGRRHLSSHACAGQKHHGRILPRQEIAAPGRDRTVGRTRMASSRVMAAAASSPPQPQPPASSDLARFRSGSGIGSMSMDDILSNIYGEAPRPEAGDGPAEPSAAPEVASRRTAEEVWKEIAAAGGLSAPAPAANATATAGGGGGAGDAAEMTLEDFLAREDDARVTGVERKMVVGFPDGAEGAAGGRGGDGGGRGRKRALMDPMDRAAMQRQKRMIKNRESAARSRERKQAYIAELEAQVTQLEEEHAQLLREHEEQNQRRLKELEEQAIAIIIRKKPSQDLRRTNSMEW